MGDGILDRNAIPVLGAFVVIGLLIGLVAAAGSGRIMIGLAAFFFAAGTFLVVWLSLLIQVPEREVWILMRFDRFAGFLLPGWRIRLPFIEQVPPENHVSLRIELWNLNPEEAKELGVEPIVGITQEGLKLPVDLAFRFQVLGLQLGRGYDRQGPYSWVFGFKNNRELRESLATMAQERVRALAVADEWHDFLGRQADIRLAITDGVVRMFGQMPGLDFLGVDVQEIQLPAALIAAAEKLEVAKKNALAKTEDGKGVGGFTRERIRGFTEVVNELANRLRMTEQQATEVALRLLGLDRWGDVAARDATVILETSPDSKLGKVELNLFGEQRRTPSPSAEGGEEGGKK